MGETKKTQIEIEVEVAPNSQGIEIKKESTVAKPDLPERTIVQEMPTISTLLGRKKLSGVVGAPAKMASPPKFSKNIFVENIEIGALEKELKRHRKSLSMQKLDMLGYLATRFELCALFKVDAAQNLAGVLGFGSTPLVENVRAMVIALQQVPATREILESKAPFVGAAANLRSEDLAVWAKAGLLAPEWMAILPVVKKNSVVAAWIAASQKSALPSEVDEKELKRLKSILSEYFLDI